jgi:predicted enzyme related to lactoylglutathione lyase
MTRLSHLRATIYAVTDVEQSKNWWASTLGLAPYFEIDGYVGFDIEGNELGLKRVADGASETVSYWGVADVADALAQAISNGATQHEPVTDIGDGIDIASVRTPDGNMLGFILEAARPAP